MSACKCSAGFEGFIIVAATGERVRVKGTFGDQARGWFDHLPDGPPAASLKQNRYDKAILDAGSHRHRLRNLRLEEFPPPPEKAPAAIRKYYFDIAPEMLPDHERGSSS